MTLTLDIHTLCYAPIASVAIDVGKNDGFAAVTPKVLQVLRVSSETCWNAPAS